MSQIDTQQVELTAKPTFSFYIREMLSFGEAVEEAKKGNYIACHTWNEREYLFLVKGAASKEDLDLCCNDCLLGHMKAELYNVSVSDEFSYPQLAFHNRIGMVTKGYAFRDVDVLANNWFAMSPDYFASLNIKTTAEKWKEALAKKNGNGPLAE